MSGADYTIRSSRDADLPAITAIYGYHVLHGVASFEEVPPDAAEIGRRRGEIVKRGLPYLVAERDGRVIGYCYAGPFRPRVARMHRYCEGPTFFSSVLGKFASNHVRTLARNSTSAGENCRSILDSFDIFANAPRAAADQARRAGRRQTY